MCCVFCENQLAMDSELKRKNSIWITNIQKNKKVFTGAGGADKFSNGKMIYEV